MTVQAFSELINAAIGVYPLLFFVELIALTIKLLLLYSLLNRTVSHKAKISYYMIIIVLIATSVEDASWLIKATHSLFLPNITYATITCVIRGAWIFNIMQTLALGLFLESLVMVPLRITWHHFLRLGIAGAGIAGFIWFMCTNFFVHSALDKSAIEFQFMSLTAHYSIIVLLLPSLLIVTYCLQVKALPRILKLQTASLIKLLILPHLILEGIQALFSHYSPTFIVTSFTIVNLSTILTTFLLYVTARKIMSMRFLNFNTHVHEIRSINSTHVLKEALEQLSSVTNVSELAHLTKSFFNNMLHIPLGHTSLFLTPHENTAPPHNQDPIACTIKHFVSQQQNSDTLRYMQKHKILIYDELAFTQFYDNHPTLTCLLDFMHQINADLFVPIYDHANLLGYIVIQRDARTALYNDLERDEIIVFAQFVAYVAVLLHNRTLETMQTNKHLKEELFCKHQEIQQCKESIQSFLSDHEHKKFGVIFYKNRLFVFGNQSAKELIGINPNVQEGHHLARDLKHLVHLAASYKTTQTCISHDSTGNRLTLNAIPNLEANNIIIIAHSPDISDIVHQQLHQLNDPSDWDHLLFLQTTVSGRLINHLIPGSHKTLINLKINLLKRALNKKSILLCLPDQDAQAVVDIVHKISLCETLHTIDLDQPSEQSIGISIFGINPLFGSTPRPLLETLNGNGTLFIKHVHRLDHQAQHHLAYFLRYGMYQPYKSEQKIRSSTRIICSTPYTITTLVQNNKLAPELIELFNDNVLELPSLLTLNNDVLGNLAEEYAIQNMATDELRSLLTLTDKDKLKLIHKRVVSLHEFKQQVRHIIQAKGRKHQLDQPTTNEPSDTIDPELLHAARLGKHALRDPQTLALLLNKFKNQNKIAAFLGVNRSSINRRCKQYHLT